MGHYNYAQHFDRFKNNKGTKEIVENNSVEETSVDKFIINNNVGNNENKIAKGKVTGCVKLYIRKDPDLKSEPIFIIDKGTEVEILDNYKEFYKIKINDKIGYCISDFIYRIE